MSDTKAGHNWHHLSSFVSNDYQQATAKQLTNCIIIFSSVFLPSQSSANQGADLSRVGSKQVIELAAAIAATAAGLNRAGSSIIITRSILLDLPTPQCAVMRPLIRTPSEERWLVNHNAKRSTKIIHL
ncbi:hypothetical protein OCU04_006423 [Sclerotinia nivalis]|uniref:Uncharacterized protein n=1 Tax=Sclerotinia nivalis TaxID=352851 RepID=A0A9X0ANV1_9HELO|nr:hypothetical protein OCU04_006423 [Sclerotinia nivalis]